MRAFRIGLPTAALAAFMFVISAQSAAALNITFEGAALGDDFYGMDGVVTLGASVWYDVSEQTYLDEPYFYYVVRIGSSYNDYDI